MAQVPELEKALNIANRSNLSVTELEELQKRETWIQDRRGETIFAKQEGLAEGRLEGQMGLILCQLERRFGELPESAIAQIQMLSPDCQPWVLLF